MLFRSSGKYYQFHGDPDQIKSILRQKLDDSLADEARVAFAYAADFFKDMMGSVDVAE